MKHEPLAPHESECKRCFIIYDNTDARDVANHTHAPDFADFAAFGQRVAEIMRERPTEMDNRTCGLINGAALRLGIDLEPPRGS